MLPPIISIVGKSNSGKTTFIEKLLPKLVERGYVIGTIKHHSHQDFEFDVKGKDSWRHKQAGAYQVIISSPNKLALVRNSESDLSLEEIRSKYFHNLDLIITEGYKRENFPKIEIFRKGVHETILCDNDDKLIALVSDTDFPVDVPKFSLDDAEGVAELIEKEFLIKNKGTAEDSKVKLFVNGKDISLKPFIQKTLKGMIEGYLQGLKGIEKEADIRIEISNNKK
ncbi:MAG: molybdopterin-guanine dinucleotide biosynthesis protein B [Candidatus Schekmanbacteria bacterium]|nr:MAG: molybdopterin-guanine dinucleotide biosynthesis protein B [Candidatus Schekmanbacteria bacterium]